MYRETEKQLTFSDDFFLPFGGKLNKKNRWVILADMIPWWKAEEKYSQAFKDSNKGEQAFSIRVALGSLIIKERLGLSDRETVHQITENPYLQYFIGLPSFQEEAPFHHSMMTHFRKRLGSDIINEVNEWIVMEEQKNEKDDDGDDHPTPPASPYPKSEENVNQSDTDAYDTSANKGKLLLDATRAPADIAYPTDLDLLNEAREKLEHIIDVLHEPLKGDKRKPRTYRQRARKDYLAVSKQRKVSGKKLRKAIGKQLNYIKRDLNIIQKLAEQSSLTLLSKIE